MKQIAILVAILSGLVVGLGGCSQFDGDVQSSVTGEVSSAEEIRSAMIDQATGYQLERIDLIAAAEKLDANEKSLSERGSAEIASSIAERESLNEMLDGGIDLVGTVTKMVFPASAGVVDMVAPLVRQGLVLAGIGGAAGIGGIKLGTRRGAAVVTEAVSEAAEADATFKSAILSGPAGDALSKGFRKAPKGVLKALEENKVI